MYIFLDRAELLNKLQKHSLYIFSFVFGICCCSLFLMIFDKNLVAENSISSASKMTSDIFIKADDPNTSSPEENTTESIFVEIAGEVLYPGVYEVSRSARVVDVFKLAGGITSKADSLYIKKKVNLADKVKDSQKIYIPFLGELKSIDTATSNESPIGEVSTKININTATVENLDSLPGIGLTLANKIVENRPYEFVTDLIEKKILGLTVYEKLKDLITL